uniref:Uncharacterized protein n=1 Tax=Anguilla anguilla TaxID=7936 RepID=A0A0E9SB32_ANGAN
MSLIMSLIKVLALEKYIVLEVKNRDSCPL